jgi:uncharacterized membrane protein YdjX (TVP38/TMEM64 family)
MKTPVRHHGLWWSLLVVLGVTWLTREAGPLEAITAWGAQVGSWGSCMLMGLYSVAPTLHFRGAALPMTGKTLCAAILGLAMLLMGTTIGGMLAYLLVRACGGVWRTPRVAQVVDAVSVGATATQVQPAK